MKIIRNLNQSNKIKDPLAITIGNFDGIHLGHNAIVKQVKKIAKEKNLASAILTFEPHPISFLQPQRAQDFRITSLAQKLKIFLEEKIDYLIILPFNKNLSEILAQDFIKKILLEALKIKHLTIGYDFTFGKNREGNFKMLEEFGLDLNEISPVKNNNSTCSSTIIRKLISEGNITSANKILGRKFIISGIVNEGRKLASQLGFPTANLKTKPHLIKPKFGVYQTETFIPHLQQTFSSITNFGIKPTLEENISSAIFETYIPNFSQNLYGKKIYVNFLEFIREEKKFANLEEIKKQINVDLKSFL